MKSSTTIGKKTILLVDDEVALLAFLTELLKIKGYNVITALNGKQAVEIYKANADGIDLVLMDINMPILNGIDAAEELKHFDPNAAILIMSGHSRDANDRVKIPHFIEKPLHPSELFKTIEDVLEESG